MLVLHFCKRGCLVGPSQSLESATLPEWHHKVLVSRAAKWFSCFCIFQNAKTKQNETRFSQLDGCGTNLREIAGPFVMSQRTPPELNVLIHFLQSGPSTRIKGWAFVIYLDFIVRDIFLLDNLCKVSFAKCRTFKNTFELHATCIHNIIKITKWPWQVV